MQIKIDKNIPLTAPRQRTGLSSTIRSMEPGDSVLVKNESQRASVASTARRIGVQTASRKVEGGFRIWRLA